MIETEEVCINYSGLRAGLSQVYLAANHYYLVAAAALQDWAGLVVVLVSTVSQRVWMMCVAGNRLWPATTELAFMFLFCIQVQFPASNAHLEYKGCPKEKNANKHDSDGLGPSCTKYCTLVPHMQIFSWRFTR